MKFILATAWLSAFAVWTAPAPAQAADAAAMLAAADRYRVAADDMQVEMRINVTRPDGTPDKERLYTVFAQRGHRSLVLMRSPADRGQKVLMLGDDFWLLLPSSQRPMRITPSQKLLGDASTGDVASMRWADDYTGRVVGEERCGEAACVRLELTSARKGVTYQRIDLWLGAIRHEPIKADLYLQSDKLAKQARFLMDKPVGGTVMTGMVLVDQLTNRKQTEVRYLSRKERSVPEAWLNPMFLVNNPEIE